jgi:hypothetical protein
MTHFTQLGLSGSPRQKPEIKAQGKTLPKVSGESQGSQSEAKKPAGKQKTAALVGSLLATALLGMFVLESGCSKESDKTATIAPPNQMVVPQLPTPTSAPSTGPPLASQPLPKKKPRQRRLRASAYTNPAYGVSFRYPSSGRVKEGDDRNLELDGLGAVEMNFVQPGGATISALQLPGKLYAGTDFHAAFFKVSVNSKLSSEQCEQFAFPETAETDPPPTSKTRVGPTEFRAVEGFAEEENNQAQVKYYHVFQNQSCYEFALGLETTAQPVPDENKAALEPAIRPVDRNEVFRQLNWILSTVKIRPVALPQKSVPEVATDTATAPANTAITEAH